MDSILVVCYSYTGNSRRLAQLLASQRGWPLGEITDTASRGALRCVLDSLLRREPPIHYRGPNPADFRTVVLISPIWAYRLAGPMRSFVAQHHARLRRVAVISTMGGAGASNAVEEIARLLGRTPILTAAFTVREIEDGSCTGRLLEFSDELLPGSAQRQKPHPSVWQPHQVHSRPPRTR
jgi:flavodoxin